jgi:ATP-dependent helicase HepA
MIGKFVCDTQFGPSKVLSVDGSRYEVEYFISPWNRKKWTVDINRVKPLRLFEQTRVYVKDANRWRMGRVIMAHEIDQGGFDYDIQFPNKHTKRFQEEDIYCRCWSDHDDPTATLALGGMETQFWYEHRQRFTTSLLAQRTACRGLSSILSSRIELVPHQIEVARRVLEDPLQRYLLADEVGMGKTIEAGIVIRQFLLSGSPGSVWIVVPDTLMRQWELELKDKFIIDDFPKRVHVISTNSLSKIPSHQVSFLVVDEAHHLVANDIPPDLLRLADATPRLLLLSATPSLGKSDVLLRLLKLLDPDCYANVDPVEFSQRVEKRDKYGLFLRGLRVDANSIVLHQRLRGLPELCGNDLEALRLGKDVSDALLTENKVVIGQSINALRGHIADVHRIHQRLIRTRRRDATGWFWPRGPEVLSDAVPNLNHIQICFVKDSRYEELFDLFDQWRIDIASKFRSTSDYRKELVNYIISLFNAMGCGIACFVHALANMPHKFLDTEWSEAFDKALLVPNIESERSHQIAIAIKTQIDELCTNRIAVFGSDSQDVEDCAKALSALIGKNKVLIARKIDEGCEDIATSFQFDSDAQVLFCRSNEEEGLNLHFVNTIIHLDIPFSPARIEQRIGRLDRFGRKAKRLEQMLILPSIQEESSLWKAWFDVLAQAFNVFNVPIADVQFSLDLISDELSEVLLDEGAFGLRNTIDKIKKKIALERDRLDNQYALDRVLQEEDAARGFFQALEDFEEDEDEIAKAVKGWIVDTLQLPCKGDYLKNFSFGWSQNTLLPAWPWATLFKDGLQGTHTFQRRNSMRRDGHQFPQLLRSGSLLMRAVDFEYRWDDRGTAFGTWRHALEKGGDEMLAFKLSYIIEACLPDGLSADERNGLRARLDGYLPPWNDSIFVDIELKPIEDPDILSLLSLPYNKARDTNLGSRQDILFGLIDQTHFEQLCLNVRDSSEVWLREQDKFKITVDQGSGRALMDVERRNRRLSQRRVTLNILGETQESGSNRETELNQEILDAVRTPVIKLDAIGVFVLSGRSLNEFMTEDA